MNPFDDGEQPDAIQQEERENVLRYANEDQTEAGSTILDRLHGGKQQTSADGKAGVGKTWLGKRIVEGMKQVTPFKTQIYLTAPTHEAVAQLREGFDNATGSKVKFGTIQSTLNLKVRWDGGEKKLVRDTSRGAWNPEPSDGDIIIVDEAYMVGHVIYHHMEEFLRRNPDVRVLWLGDKGQLPPVGERPAGVLDDPDATLEKIVRQNQGSPIIEAASIIREGEPGWRNKWTNKADGEEMKVLTDPQEMKEKVFSIFENHQGYYGARVLCHTNARAEAWNRRIRNHLYPNADEWAKGMKAMATDVWNGPRNYGPLHTSQILRVDSAKKKTRRVAHNEDADDLIEGPKMEVWELKLDPARSSYNISAVVPTEASKDAYEDELSRRKRKCKEGRLHWKNFYRLKESMAPLTAGYASTTHKSQGSTIRRVIIDSENILNAPGGAGDQQALMYVAATRASEELVVLKNQ